MDYTIFSLNICFLYIYVRRLEGMNLHSDPARFLPLVKTIAAQTRETVASDVDLDQLVKMGHPGVTAALTQYRARQGLTLRIFVAYKIRSAIYDGLSGRSWPNKESRSLYLFAKKSNELMMHFHLSAEGTIKRSIKAEEEEVLQLLGLLAVIALIIFGEERILDLKRSMNLLNTLQKNFIKYYYEQDLSMESAAEKIALSRSMAFRFHLQILETLAADLSTNSEVNV
jgi:DNA-directed RNA polymerase specialized sigma subunit